MNNQDFEVVQKKAEEVVIMPDKLQEIIDKNNYLPTLIQQWTKLFSKQTYLVQSLKVDLEELYGQLFKYYKFDDNVTWGSTKEIETQIHSDTKYTTKLREYNTQKYYLDYIAETLNTIKNLNFIIKNYLDYKKITTTNF